MIWNNLKSNKCPKCGKTLDWKQGIPGVEVVYICPDSKCDFKIGEKKFTDTVRSLYRKGDRNEIKHYRPADENPE
jgi:ssDNA-binding Zn-finger/Zn-ribbon topoisomerase 1